MLKIKIKQIMHTHITITTTITGGNIKAQNIINYNRIHLIWRISIRVYIRQRKKGNGLCTNQVLNAKDEII